MKKSVFRRLTALLLLLAMLLSVTSCLEEDIPDITIIPNAPTDDPTDDPTNDPTDDPATHKCILASG